MSNPVIVLGDKTSHGGTVVTCSPLSDTHGKGWARVGDMVSCPRCKGVFPISQGDTSLIDAGQAVAFHGSKTACGATLLSSQLCTLTTPSGGAAPGAHGSLPPMALMQGFGIIHTGLASRYQDEPVADETERFRGRFQVVDATTGDPVRSLAVRVRSTDGQYIMGSTDEDGFTQWVERDGLESLAFDLIQDGDA